MKFLSEKSSFYTLVKPFVRFCLNNSLKVQEILEMVKEALVEIASEELQKCGQEASISKISAITGLQRRDISKLLKETGQPASHLNLITKVIGQWQHNCKFLSDAGLPLRLSVNGKESEFSNLVKSISADLNPYAVLFELERLGLVKKQAAGVTLASDFAQLGTENLAQVISLVARQKSDLICAVEENISRLDPTPNLHLSTEFDNIDSQVLPDLRKWILSKGSEFHAQLRKKLSGHDKDLNPKILGLKKGVRVSVCAFSRIEEK